MKHFPGKITVVFIFLILTTIGCSKCPHSKSDFVNRLETLDNVKEIILKNTPEDVKQYKEQALQTLIDKEDFEILEALYIDNIYKIRSVVIFTFKHPYEKDWIDKRAQQNLESCNTHIIYGENIDDKNNVLSYPRYAECRYKKEDLKGNWTYVFQKWYCAD